MSGKKNNKILTILIVSIFIFLSIAVNANASNTILNKDKVEDTGEMKIIKPFSNLDKKFYIQGEKGTVFMGKVYRKYVPINLEDEYKKEGLKVEFTGKIAFDEFFSITSLKCLFLKALPIKIDTIKTIEENEVDLKYDIIVDESYEINEKITVNSNIRNDGSRNVLVSEMALELGTLDFIIKTPDNHNIHYIGDFVKRKPKTILIEPEKTYDISIEDITKEGLFGNEENGFYDFRDGVYKIVGIYISGECGDDEVVNSIVKDKFISSEYKFNIIKEETQNHPPIADFDYEPKKPFVGQEIIFMDLSTDPDDDDLIYHWDFDNSSEVDNVNEKNPVFVYDKAGDYVVRLIVTDEKNESDIACKKITVSEEPSPEEAYIYGKVREDPILPVPEYIPIIDALVELSDVENESYYSINSDENGYFKIKIRPGCYSMFVSKEGYENYTRDISITSEEIVDLDIVLKKINQPPKAIFVYAPLKPLIGEEINFRDFSKDIDGEIVEWLWDFGDGTKSINQNPEHVYKEPGEYQIYLKVVDNDGAKDEYSEKIEIKEYNDPEKTGRIQGLVFEQSVFSLVKYKPIVGAKVVAYQVSSSNNEERYETITDEKGSFELIVPIGEYTLEVKQLGYEPKTKKTMVFPDKVSYVIFPLRPLR